MKKWGKFAPIVIKRMKLRGEELSKSPDCHTQRASRGKKQEKNDKKSFDRSSRKDRMFNPFTAGVALKRHRK